MKLTPMKDHKDYMLWNDAKIFIKKAENLRDKALFSLLLLTGKRVSEVLSLRVSDIDFEAKTIRFKILKKRKEHYDVLPANELLLLILARYIEEYRLHKNDWLFPSISRKGRHITRQWVDMLIKYYAKKYNIRAQNGKLPHAHTFRHTFASQMARKIKNVSEIKVMQEYMGHSDINMTMFYIKAYNEAYRRLVEDVLLD